MKKIIIALVILFAGCGLSGPSKSEIIMELNYLNSEIESLERQYRREVDLSKSDLDLLEKARWHTCSIHTLHKLSIVKEEKEKLSKKLK